MKGFNTNPIVVIDNGKPYKIIEHKIDCEYENFIFEVYKDDKLILSEKIEENSFIRLNRDLNEVVFLYKDLSLEKILGKYTVSLEKAEIIVNIDHEGLLYEKLKNDVKCVMDNPEGSEEEKTQHTELLNKVTIDRDARNYVNSKIRKTIVATNLVPDDKVEEYTYKIFSDFYGLGVIQELDDDIEVGEILVNAVEYPRFKSEIYYFKHGVKIPYNKEFKSKEEIERVFNKCIEFENKQLNSVEHAIVEATRPNRDRVNIIIPKASNNWVLNIRKFGNFVPNLNMMKKSGTVDDFIEKLYKVIVEGKANIGIGGPMGTGKTTMINFMLTYTEPSSRKVVISSVDETDVDRVLKGHDVVVLNVNEEKGFTFEKHIKTALRTTADRVIIPESRGGEFKQVVEANYKTKGNLFTAHALDDESFMDMCVDMYMSGSTSSVEGSDYVKNKLSKAIDIIIIMRKVDGAIRIKSISEVLSKDGVYKGMNKLYYWYFNPENPSEGEYRRTENRMSKELKERLNEFGVPMSSMKDL